MGYFAWKPSTELYVPSRRKRLRKERVMKTNQTWLLLDRNEWIKLMRLVRALFTNGSCVNKGKMIITQVVKWII